MLVLCTEESTPGYARCKEGSTLLVSSNEAEHYQLNLMLTGK